MAQRFLAVGANSKQGVSTDGSTWTVNAGHPDTSPTGLGYNPTADMLVSGATGSSTMYRSTDTGANWSGAASEPFTGSTRMALWVPDLSLWIAGGEDARIASAGDGSNFTQRTLITGLAPFVRGAAWSPTVPIAVVGTRGTKRRTTSADLITWAAPTTITYNINALCWCTFSTPLFVAAGGQSSTVPIVETSTNGTTGWTNRTLPAGITKEIWGAAFAPTLGTSGRVVIVTEGGEIAYSDNGTSYTAVTSPTSSALRAVAWSPTLNLFVAVGDAGTMVSSSDGITWSTVTSGFGASNINSIIWADNGVTSRGLVVGMMSLN